MTEQELIKVLDRMKYIAGLPDQGSSWKANAETIALDIAISALEEIQQYRAIGTVKEFQELKEISLSGLELAYIAARMMRLKKYESIGTVEECREAVEKQKAKRPLEYESHEDYEEGICPKCGVPVNSVFKCCTDCGQKMDWSKDVVSDSR